MPKKAHLVREVLYSETAHNFGDDTETGVANVTMLIDEDEVFGIGQDRDHTGIDMGGGGGTTGVESVGCCCLGLDIFRDVAVDREGCIWNALATRTLYVVSVMMKRVEVIIVGARWCY